jgi:hypothetical protein
MVEGQINQMGEGAWSGVKNGKGQAKRWSYGERDERDASTLQ